MVTERSGTRMKTALPRRWRFSRCGTPQVLRSEELIELSNAPMAPSLLFLRCMKPPNQRPEEAALQKDPDEWKTGDEPMTAAQRSYLETLARDAGETFDEELTKAEASKRIEELQQRSPRVADQ
jgi:hypothetical protein